MPGKRRPVGRSQARGVDRGPAAAWAGAAVSAVILNITPTAAGYYLGVVAGRTPVEVLLVLADVLITCYLAHSGCCPAPASPRARS